MLIFFTFTKAPKPSSGPHKQKDCFPLILFIRNKLGYALNGAETKTILAQRLVKVDNKIRTDPKYPAGFMDVIQIEKTGENFRMLYDVKGRFAVHRIHTPEAQYKLCKVVQLKVGAKSIPFIVTHDGRTIRYPDPIIRVNDTIKFDLKEGKIVGIVKFDNNKLAYVTGGHNKGRIGTIVHREKHRGGLDIIKMKDSAGNVFLTRLSNVFVIGEHDDPLISLPTGNGIRVSRIEEAEAR